MVKKKEKRERERRVGISLFLVNLMFTRDLTYLTISCSCRVKLEFWPSIFFLLCMLFSVRSKIMKCHTNSEAFIEALRRYHSAVESAQIITV
jgi:hypothetical protein